VIQVGGFLGLGGHLVAVPFDSLKVEDAGANDDFFISPASIAWSFLAEVRPFHEPW
jgi:hypothetical protein